MYKKILIALLAGSLLIVGFGCSKKDTADNSATNNAQSATGTDTTQAPQQPTINADEAVAKITKALDAKFPGSWSVSGTTLKKGDYTENDHYGIAAEILNVYPGAMVSVFVGETRISSTIKQDGKPVLSGYPTPPEVGQTMKSGKASVVSAGSMGSASYQKIFMPVKDGDKTVAVITISVAQ